MSNRPSVRYGAVKRLGTRWGPFPPRMRVQRTFRCRFGGSVPEKRRGGRGISSRIDDLPWGRGNTYCSLMLCPNSSTNGPLEGNMGRARVRPPRVRRGDIRMCTARSISTGAAVWAGSASQSDLPAEVCEEPFALTAVLAHHGPALVACVAHDVRLGDAFPVALRHKARAE